MQDLQSISGTGRFFPGSTSRLHRDPNLKCPRCDSPNTKFCYYNNYNLSQPRHFCKSCRRYWTKGGVLRNVPIGGGCRKSKRSSSSSSLSSKSPKSARVSSKPKDPSSTSDTSSSLTSVPDPVVSVAGAEVGIIPETSNSYVFPDLAGFGDEIVPVDLVPMFGNPTAGLDWHQGCPDPVNGLFDPISADAGMFWAAQNHWPEPDPYLLP